MLTVIKISEILIFLMYPELLEVTVILCQSYQWPYLVLPNLDNRHLLNAVHLMELCQITVSRAALGTVSASLMSTPETESSARCDWRAAKRDYMWDLEQGIHCHCQVWSRHTVQGVDIFTGGAVLKVSGKCGKIESNSFGQICLPNLGLLCCGLLLLPNWFYTLALLKYQSNWDPCDTTLLMGDPWVSPHCTAAGPKEQIRVAPR